jgi:hypothetical protein
VFFFQVFPKFALVFGIFSKVSGVDSRQIFRGFDVPPAFLEDRSEKCRECAVKILRSLVENTSDLSAALCLGA